MFEVKSMREATKSLSEDSIEMFKERNAKIEVFKENGDLHSACEMTLSPKY
jgi:hypothetical protein